jgi:hypothetical protein
MKDSIPRSVTMLGLVAAVFVTTACNRGALHTAVKDAGKGSPEVSSDLPVTDTPVVRDAAANQNLARDVATGRDAQPDGEDATPEAGRDRPDTNDAVPVDGEAGRDGGVPGACTGTLVLGKLPLVQLGDYYSESTAITDLNGDGQLDIVGAGKGVSVLLGQGDGRFATRTDYATDVYRAAIVVGDFNGDGKPDVAVANAGTATVSVLLGKGDGTFAPEVQYATADSPVSLAIGDLNNDGRPDLVTANGGNSSMVSVLLGKSDGTFAPKLDWAPIGDPRSMALGDVNGDGKLDLVLANGANPLTLRVALGKGDGTFAAGKDPSFQSTLGLDGASVALGDVNGDGKLDIAVTVGYSGDVAVLLGNGDGTFAAPLSISTGGDTVGIFLRDLNGDGKLDIVTAGTGKGVRVSLGRGDGSFAAEVVYPAAGAAAIMRIDDR